MSRGNPPFSQGNLANMSRLAAVALAITLAIGLGGCATSSDGASSPDQSQSIPTPDAALIPEAPAETITAVDAAAFDDGFGSYVFRVGDGPSWCTITTDIDQVICEQNEAAASYLPIPAPADCDGSYGYQIRLFGSKPEIGDVAGFLCSTGQWQDPAGAQVLANGTKITAGVFTCYVKDTAARCQNENGQYIALGPKVWAIHN
ncbi:MAG: hypothetical protein RJA66_312 [Actinomycetota bacterium]